MTTYYVGPGGNNGNAGTSWATRKLTLNGAEDIPVVAGDTVYVGAGTYRETLTCDVAGGAGTPITYIGDVFGANTDGVGGFVRVTGSDDDQSATRNYGIDTNNKNYRTFRGFVVDGCAQRGIQIFGDNVIVEDCAFMHNNQYGIYRVSGSTDLIIRRCWVMWNMITGIQISASVTEDNTNILIENCIVSMNPNSNIYNNGVGGLTINNCTIVGGYRGVRQVLALNPGQTSAVYNSQIIYCLDGLFADVAGDLVEDYNNLRNNTTDRTNVAVGANSVSYLPMMKPPFLQQTRQYIWNPIVPADWSSLASIVGSAEATEDIYGFTRAANSSYGAVQYNATRRPIDAGTSRGRRGT